MHISNIKFAKSGDLNIAYERFGRGPDVVVIPPLVSNVELDANAELANIKAPTLVRNVIGDRISPPAVGRFLADKIPGARYEEFEGDDHFCWIMPRWREMTDCC
jgi:pimeloyl-ACP methyl ester carboxylesterase